MTTYKQLFKLDTKSKTRKKQITVYLSRPTFLQQWRAMASYQGKTYFHTSDSFRKNGKGIYLLKKSAKGKKQMKERKQRAIKFDLSQ